MERRSTLNDRRQSDGELIRAYQETRDQQLFAQLVTRHQNRVFSMCVRLLGSASLAEEVAQDVFVAVYRNLDRFRGDSKFTTWLYRVVVNHCKNKQAYRARRHEKKHESIDKPHETEGGGEVQRQLPSHNPSPEKELVAKQRRELLEQGLTRLKEEHRAVIVMYDLNGMAYDEIAEVLEVKEGTVKSRLHRARSELKNVVGRLLASHKEALSEG